MTCSPGDIYEVAAVKCGGAENLQKALDRGAATKTVKNGIEYYNIGQLETGETESFTSGYKLARSRNTTHSAFKMVQDMMNVMGWIINADTKALEVLTCIMYTSHTP